MVNYKNYKVWQRSHKLVLQIYSLIRKYPKTEQFGLISSGSAHELDYLLRVSNELGFIDEEKASLLITEIDEIKKVGFLDSKNQSFS